jgi:glycosyltransferase involved in cell wall biosynthesis
MKHLEGLVKARGLENNIIFKGRVKHQDKVKLMNESSFLVFPSLVEGFGIVVLESYAFKKPVLASDIMPLPEIVDNNQTGFTIPPFDSNAWTEKMIYLFENSYRARQMGLKGYTKLRQRYVIEKVVDKLEKLYSCLSRKGR